MEYMLSWGRKIKIHYMLRCKLSVEANISRCRLVIGQVEYGHGKIRQAKCAGNAQNNCSILLVSLLCHIKYYRKDDFIAKGQVWVAACSAQSPLLGEGLPARLAEIEWKCNECPPKS
jgi:hypothetical protein